MRIVRRATAFLAEAPGLVIQTTTATRLADRGPLIAIWYQVPSDSLFGSHNVGSRSWPKRMCCKAAKKQKSLICCSF
jgi:hypothetical protein